MNSSETIVAISSAVGGAARMIVRVSGEETHRIARHLTDGVQDGSAFRCRLWPGMTAWIYWFTAPRSYTGDDLVEFHIPGNPLLARMLLDEMVRLGARQAEAGEFTARGYLNGRMDLTQAEGVAATISANSQREMRAARQLLGGELARRLGPVMDGVAEALALVEVGIDFSDEDVTFLSADDVRERCRHAASALGVILEESARFERLSHEPRIVLVGRPNAGKSTLLNALAGAARAVVSNVAGTTRDAIWAEVRLARGMVKVVDVAGVGSGFRVQGSAEVGSAVESIEIQMQEQAMRAVEVADLVVWVEDSCLMDGQIELGREVNLVVQTKADLLEGDQGRKDKRQKTEETDKNVCPTASETEDKDKVICPGVLVSAATGEGLDALRHQLDQIAFGAESGAGLALNARHVRGIVEAFDALARAADAVEAGAEVVAMELREALESLGGVLGKMSPDDLLGRVFSRFCIGK
jgi:tRNA modification GTPase